MIKMFLFFQMCQKIRWESDVMKQWKNPFFESSDTEVFKADRNKLFASNEKQIDNHTFIIDVPRLNMWVVCTYYCRDVFKKNFLVWLLFFVDLCSQKRY